VASTSTSSSTSRSPTHTAYTGSLSKLGIVGRDGHTLDASWIDGPRTYLGFMAPGFPNLFTITGPQSPISLYNNPLAIEDHVQLASTAIEQVLAAGQTTLEATPEATALWGTIVAGLAEKTLLPKANSWYMGANVEGKPRQCMLFIGGAPLYRLMCDLVVAGGWSGFARDGASSPVPALLRLDSAARSTSSAGQWWVVRTWPAKVSRPGNSSSFEVESAPTAASTNRAVNVAPSSVVTVQIDVGSSHTVEVTRASKRKLRRRSKRSVTCSR